MTEPRIFVEYPPTLRQALGSAIEALIEVLDQLDPDAELENEPADERGCVQYTPLGDDDQEPP